MQATENRLSPWSPVDTLPALQHARCASGASSVTGSDWPGLWERVESLVERAPNVDALQTHRLQLVAARVWRSRGQQLPAEISSSERQAAMVAMATPFLLAKLRSGCSGRLMLMKGPEVAARYPHPGDRLFRDLDLLADDVAGAQRALIGAGFKQVADPAEYVDAQHLCPLIWPGIPLIIELHRHLNQPAWLPCVPAEELLTGGVPSALGVEGLLAPNPAAHVLVLAAHGWAHEPLGRLRDLVDIAALSEGGTAQQAAELAKDWGWSGIWRVTRQAVEAVLGEEADDASLPTWARHLSACRERTVWENHFARLAAPLMSVPAARIPAAVTCALRETASRRRGERWGHKWHRAWLALTHARLDRSTHDRIVER